MKKLMIAFAGAAAIGLSASAAVDSWFNGGIGSTWPTTSATGGEWSNTDQAEAAGSSIEVFADSSKPLTFTATQAQVLGSAAGNADLLNYESVIQFTPFEFGAMPDPANKVGVIVAKKDSVGTLAYYVLAKVEGTTNEWVEVSEVSPVADKAVKVSISVSNNDGIKAVYAFDDTVLNAKAIDAGDANFSYVAYTGDGVVSNLVATKQSYMPWSGEGTEARPWLINNAGALDNLATWVKAGNTFSGNFFALTADVDLQDYAAGFFGIGTEQNMFAGTFDGQNNKISNVVVTNNYGGVFGYVSGTVKNLIVENITFAGDAAEYGGAIVGTAKGGAVLQNLTMNGHVGSSDKPAKHNASGIAVRSIPDAGMTISILSCTNNADIYGSYTKYAGIVGYTGGSGTSLIQDCCNGKGVKINGIGEWASADHTKGVGQDGMAGIIGYVGGTTTVDSCSNFGEMFVNGRLGCDVNPMSITTNFVIRSLVGRVNASLTFAGHCIVPYDMLVCFPNGENGNVSGNVFATAPDEDGYVDLSVAASAIASGANVKLMVDDERGSKVAAAVVLPTVGNTVRIDQSLSSDLTVTQTAGETAYLKTTNVDDVYTYKVINNACKIGDEHYGSLADALAEAKENDEIELIQAASLGEDTEIPAGVTLNLADTTLTFTATLTLNGALKCDATGSNFTNNGEMVISSTSVVWMGETKMFGAGDGKFRITAGTVTQTAYNGNPTLGMNYEISANGVGSMTGDFNKIGGAYVNDNFYLNAGATFTAPDADQTQAFECIFPVEDLQETMKVVRSDAGVYSLAEKSVEYTITIAEGIENGSITADKAKATADETITITATPADGYQLDTITTNDIAISGTTFVMPADDVEVSATFTACTYTITYKWGDTELTGLEPSNYVYGVGETLPVTVELGLAGVEFVAWTNDVGDTVATIGKTDIGDRTFYAQTRAVTQGPTVDDETSDVEQQSDGSYKVTVDSSNKTPEVTIPTGSTVEIVVDPSTTTIKAKGANEKTTIKVTYGDNNITGAFKTPTAAELEAGATLELDPNGSVTIGDDTIPVKPEIGDDVGPSDPFVVGDTTTTKVASIPGLTYTLKRRSSPSGEGTTAAQTTASGTSVSLTDDFKGLAEKPEKAFYVIEVTK